MVYTCILTHGVQSGRPFTFFTFCLHHINAHKVNKGFLDCKTYFLWSVETKSELFLNSKHNIWRKMSTAHHLSIPNMKQSGGSFMLWGCFSAVEAWRLVRAEKKRDVLHENLF